MLLRPCRYSICTNEKSLQEDSTCTFLHFLLRIRFGASLNGNDNTSNKTTGTCHQNFRAVFLRKCCQFAILYVLILHILSSLSVHNFFDSHNNRKILRYVRRRLSLLIQISIKSPLPFSTLLLIVNLFFVSVLK